MGPCNRYTIFDVTGAQTVAALRRPQLSEEIAAYVREAVMSGQLRPGEFIRLDTVAQQLGTSVTPVREALDRKSVV